MHVKLFEQLIDMSFVIEWLVEDVQHQKNRQSHGRGICKGEYMLLYTECLDVSCTLIASSKGSCHNLDR